jgi:hypothetical protein
MANPSTHTAAAAPPRVEINHEQALTRIREALRDLRFGEVTIVLQDGFVVQVERTEKLRMTR